MILKDQALTLTSLRCFYPFSTNKNDTKNGYHLTGGGTLAKQYGRFGAGVRQNGSAPMGRSDSLGLTSSTSAIVFFIRLKFISINTNDVIFNWENTTGTPDFGLQFRVESTTQFSIGWGTGASTTLNLPAHTVLNTTDWYDIAVLLKTGTNACKLYINGVLCNSFTRVTGDGGTNNFYIGAEWDNQDHAHVDVDCMEVYQADIIDQVALIKHHSMRENLFLL